MEGWTPLVLENVEANSANFVDVRMIDFCSKEHFGRNHGILVRKEQFSAKETACIRSVVGSLDLHMEMSKVCFVWSRIDSNN